MAIEIIRLAVIGVIVLFGEIGAAPLLSIYGTRPDLLLVFSLAVTLRHGRNAGLTTGFLSGLAQDVAGMGFIGVNALTKSTVCYWLGTWLAKEEKTIKPLGWTLITVIAAISCEIISAVFVLQGSSISFSEYFLTTVLPRAFYTAAIGFIWALAPVSSMVRSPSHHKQHVS